MNTSLRARLAPVLRATPRHVKELALTLGAIGGLACITLAISALVFGLQPLVVQSGSMEPTVAAGSLLITEKTPASELRRGDVVTVPRQDRALVTHRITEITLRGDTATLRLKGDANDVVDPQAYVVKEAGKKVFVVPYAGWVAAWAASGLGLFLLGVYVAFLAFAVAVDWRDRPWRRDAGRGRGRPEVDGKPVRGGKRKAVRRGLSAAGMAAITLGAMTAPLATPLPTLGAWTDDATAGTSTLSVYTVPVPQNFRCGALGLLSVQFQWDAVAGATDYTLHYGPGGSSTVTVTGTSRTITTAISGGTAWVTANRNFGSTTWTSANSNTRTYTVAVVSLCA